MERLHDPTASHPMRREGTMGPAPTPRTAREGTIDFWRGLVLCMIFVNHIPGNVFEKLTYRNLGFSDSAEAFVFLSGLSLALAYGQRFAGGRPGPAILRLGRRTVRLYAIHIELSLAGLAVFAVGAAVFPGAGLMDVHGRDLAVDDPLAAVVGIVTLGHQLGYFNILPLYVLLVAGLPVLLWLARYGRAPMLGASLALYAVARVFHINIPTWPMRGEWFLDPFTWQLLMATGVAVGLGWHGKVLRPNHLLLALSVAAVAVAAVCATDGFGFVPGLFDTARGLCDLDKTMLGSGRLIHFLALAYLVRASGITARLRATPIYAPLSRMGRHGLPIFAILSLLAAVGQVLTQGLGHSLVLDALVVGGGLAALDAAARLLDAPLRPRTAVTAALQRR